MAVDAEAVIEAQIDTEQDSEKTTEAEKTVVDTEDEGAEPEYTEHERKMFDRAKKAEVEVKELKAKLKTLENKQQPQDSSQLSPMDTIALVNAKITNKEDIEDVADYARFKKISVSEALNSGVMKTHLAQKAEERASAEAANTSGSRRSSGKVTDDTLLANWEKGILPESEDDIRRLWRARQGKKRAGKRA